ncbi:MAG: hypothetical protein RR979_03695, partial [Mucinivorans sp.]
MLGSSFIELWVVAPSSRLSLCDTEIGRTASFDWSRGDTEIAVYNNIIKNNTVSKMRISVVELPEINCSRRLSFEFERLD